MILKANAEEKPVETSVGKAAVNPVGKRRIDLRGPFLIFVTLGLFIPVNWQTLNFITNSGSVTKDDSFLSIRDAQAPVDGRTKA